MKQSPACKTGMRGQPPEATLLASSDTTGLCATLAHASEKWSRAKNILFLLQQGVLDVADVALSGCHCLRLQQLR